MDLVRLGLRNAKRNWTRTVLAMGAMALAAVTLVLSGVIPSGYVKGIAFAERVFIGGDILVLPLGGPIEAGWDDAEQSKLSWKPWQGRHWQSYASYFLPGLVTQGQVGDWDASWHAFDPDPVVDAARSIDGVKAAAPYFALPCILQVGDKTSPAILRAWGTGESGDYLSYFDQEFLVSGQPLNDSSPNMSCLFPLQGTSLDAATLQSVRPLDAIQVTVPRPTYGFGSQPGPIGLTWDYAVTDTLSVSGIYQVQVGSAPDTKGDSGGPPSEMEPVYWERPEVIVSLDTFGRLVGGDEPDDPVVRQLQRFPSGFSVYQVTITVDRMATAKTVAKDLAAVLGPGFSVIPVPDLLQMKNAGSLMGIGDQNARRFSQLLLFVLSSVIVAGSIYVILTQERRKIGLLRVVGATSKEILGYVMTLCAYVALTGSSIGFGVGKALSSLALLSADVTFHEWVRQTLRDAVTILGLSLGIPLALGLAIGIWAARIPSSEVLKRD